MSSLSAVLVRAATGMDAAAVAAIYNAGIDARLATFETEHRSADAMATRIDGTRPPHHFLVAERADRPGRVLGWAATFPYSPRRVYAGIAEYSVYVDAGVQRQGVGRALLSGLVDRSARAGLHKLTSRIFPENTASLALAERLGFRVVGTHLSHARLDGLWRDVVTVEVLLPAARHDS